MFKSANFLAKSSGPINFSNFQMEENKLLLLSMSSVTVALNPLLTWKRREIKIIRSCRKSLTQKFAAVPEFLSKANAVDLVLKIQRKNLQIRGLPDN